MALGKETMKVVSQVRLLLTRLPAEQRVEFLNECVRGYCKHCGTDVLPCYCWRDE